MGSFIAGRRRAPPAHEVDRCPWVVGCGTARGTSNLAAAIARTGNAGGRLRPTCRPVLSAASFTTDPTRPAFCGAVQPDCAYKAPGGDSGGHYDRPLPPTSWRRTGREHHEVVLDLLLKQARHGGSIARSLQHCMPDGGLSFRVGWQTTGAAPPGSSAGSGPIDWS
jgi:hypothetical protein